MLHHRHSHKPSTELLDNFQHRYAGFFPNQIHDETLQPPLKSHKAGKFTEKPSSIESTLTYHPAAQYSSFNPHDMPSYQNDLQVSHSDFKSAQLGSQTELPLMNQFGMDENTQYQADGQYSPKHLVQMNDIYSLPDGSSGFPQNDPWGSSFDISSVAQPLGNTGIDIDTDVKMDMPIPHRDSGYETTNTHDETTRFNENSMSQSMNRRDSSFEKWQSESLRFCAILGAPTAMTRNSEEPTLTYLNKGQAYKLSIMDTKPSIPGGPMKQYRAFVRVSFDQEQARANPVACWQLWKEARAMNLSSQKDRLPFALEFDGPANSNFQCQVEQESFDCFCITWEMEPATGFNLCDLSIRLHFLSTDFTRSKGVKGIPIRLCVKMQELMSPEESEISFCRVQLFRDHGAERKMSNDSGNLNKAIEKLKHKMSNTSLKPVAVKRKRGRIPRLNDETLEAMRVPKFEMKSGNDGLESKLVELEHMALSTQPRTVLALRGSKEDDPDLYAVHLPDLHNRPSSETSPGNTTRANSKDSASEVFTPIDAVHPDIEKTGLAHQKQRVGSFDSTDTSIDGSITHPSSLVACFYVQQMLEVSQQVYRAIYLTERTSQALARAIAKKYGFTPTDDFNIFHISDKDLKILVDDDFVQQIPEGQHMTIRLDKSSVDGSTAVSGMQLLY